MKSYTFKRRSFTVAPCEPIIEERRQPDGSKIVVFTIHVPRGYHAIEPEIDRND